MNTPIRTVSKVMVGMSLAALLAACNSVSDDPKAAGTSGHNARSTVARECYDCGTIVSIEEMKSKGSGTGVGAITGAVAGAVVGHQIGDGRGQDIATVAGAVGGGFAGNEIERRVKGSSRFHVTVAMEDGSVRIVDVRTLNGFATGSRVKILGTNVLIASL